MAVYCPTEFVFKQAVRDHLADPDGGFIEEVGEEVVQQVDPRRVLSSLGQGSDEVAEFLQADHVPFLEECSIVIGFFVAFDGLPRRCALVLLAPEDVEAFLV